MNYSPYFKDYISRDSFNSTSKNVLEWIRNNREKVPGATDPNAYEMANIFLFGSKYSHEGGDVDVDTLTQMWNIRSQDFTNCNVSENNFVYAICQDAYNAAISGQRLVNDEDSHDALRSMAGIGLFLKQQKRDSGEISYNNPRELLNLLDSSSTLKMFHPDLFEKYAFEENLNVLCKLQLYHDLPPRTADSIRSYQQQLAENRDPSAKAKASFAPAEYLCTKISEDAYKVVEFLRRYERQANQGTEDKGDGSTSAAHSYYYSLYFELSNAMTDFANEKFSSGNFQNIFDTICRKYNVDLNLLLDSVRNIPHLEEPSHHQEQQDFVKLLDSKATEHFESQRKQNDQENTEKQ